MWLLTKFQPCRSNIGSSNDIFFKCGLRLKPWSILIKSAPGADFIQMFQGFSFDTALKKCNMDFTWLKWVQQMRIAGFRRNIYSFRVRSHRFVLILIASCYVVLHRVSFYQLLLHSYCIAQHCLWFVNVIVLVRIGSFCSRSESHWFLVVFTAFVL